MGLAEDDASAPQADLFVRWGRYPQADPAERLVAWSPCPTHGVDIQVWRAPDGAARVWNRGIGTFYVHGSNRTVDVFPEPGADQTAIRAVLLGPVWVLALHRRGWPTLHASAVLVNGQAVAFVGPRGQGKSTLAAAFIARGHGLLTDDLLPLRPNGQLVRAIAGPPQLKLWPDAARCTLGLDGSLPDALPALGKKLVPLASSAGPGAVPLAAAYVLDRQRSDGEVVKVTIQEVRGRWGLITLLAYTLNRSYLLSAEEAGFLGTYALLVNQGRLRRLSLPDGLGYLEDAYRQVIADLG